jgi:hypothetical protein
MRFIPEQGDSRLAVKHPEFSVREHVTFLAGYMDAVGRVLTTDTELWALTARSAGEALESDRILGAAIRSKLALANWSREFGSLVDDFLGMDQRSRLGFYLIDYICWFREFTNGAVCHKLECESLGPETISQAVYLLQIEGTHGVLLLFQRLDKTHNKRLQPIGCEDAPSG